MQQKESKTNWHFNISLAKSALRIAAGGYLAFNNTWYAGVLLIMAEILGILEEL